MTTPKTKQDTTSQKHKRMSVAELKEFAGFENHTEEQAEQTIQTLERLSIMVYEMYVKQNQIKQTLTILKGGNKYNDNEEQRNAA